MKTTSLAMASLYLIGIVMVQAAEADKPDSPRERVARVQIKQLDSALKLFMLDCAVPPTEKQGLKALIVDPEIKGWNGPYIDGKKVLLDPWGTAFRYMTPKERDAPAYRIISAGRDKKFGTKDDISSSDKR